MTLEELKAKIEAQETRIEELENVTTSPRIEELENVTTSPRDDHAHDKVERIARAVAHIITFLTPWGFSVGAAEEPAKDDAS